MRKAKQKVTKSQSPIMIKIEDLTEERAKQFLTYDAADFQRIKFLFESGRSYREVLLSMLANESIKIGFAPDDLVEIELDDKTGRILKLYKKPKLTVIRMNPDNIENPEVTVYR